MRQLSIPLGKVRTGGESDGRHHKSKLGNSAHLFLQIRIFLDSGQGLFAQDWSTQSLRGSARKGGRAWLE